ncbi:MAG: ribonuclease HII [Candidatus Yanofskybacteria bacterium RIFCSPLOWO2_01_FULL_49_17]|uniref:Ribonuclease n=1 Tax=Candidatus Yanofskybacteria bacterium RIFCSPLOWO2_01_FULL_49_17 TaxID=1802700 RepID=A0A1F8GRG1_9BACT|nr:MAG: ribonuclease HII [Candidatus Yanofskybacteria bacterium RIFCSPLOWO2_01_FULL_49_17]
MKLPHKTLEKGLFNKGYGYVCAVDEVGIGCLAGPVVVCAVGMTSTFHKKIHKKLHNLRESKLLLPKQREKFARWLIEDQQLVYTLASSSPKVIDKINIYQAARRAMRRAVQKVSSISYPVSSTKNQKIPNTKYQIQDTGIKTMVLIDGPHKISKLDIEQIPVVKGDRKIFAIACASIIAKVHRDHLMIKMAKRYPGYGLERHKGYGTKYHQSQLAALGPSAIHRRSFAPVRKML